MTAPLQVTRLVCAECGESLGYETLSGAQPLAGADYPTRTVSIRCSTHPAGIEGTQ